MFRFAYDNMNALRRDARNAGRAGMAVQIDVLSWWRGNWWRLQPPAVPLASYGSLDF